MSEKLAKFRWLPPGLRPPVKMTLRQETVFLLVGVAALFAGYDVNIYSLAIPQIQASLHIPENQVGLTVSYFRLAAVVAMLIAASADLVGRRRLLLVTIFGQAIFTLVTAFSGNYLHFVWAQILTRVFGYAEEMLCFVVIAEEVAAGARGWANGTLSAMYWLGAGVASLVFALVNLLPFGWRAIYVIGSVPLFLVGFLRQRLPETQRFAAQEGLQKTKSKFTETLVLLRAMVKEYPGRIAIILVTVTAWGFAISPATVFSLKYLQTDYHYTPGAVTALTVPGGILGLVLAILAGKLSDRIGRKPMAIAMGSLCGIGFYFFYSGVGAHAAAALWIVSFFGFFSGDALIAGFALEIVPTQYRATVASIRYLVEIGAGAVALALEGHLYDIFHGHGPANQWLLITIPIALVMILFLPEPAGKQLEEMS